jgi:serine/threonine protein kinase
MTFEQIGKYKVVGRIGRGAMGEVYKAVDPTLGRDVAIKTISASLGSDNDLRTRFQREAQAAARLNHPNIITVYEFAEEQGTIYMAMELLEGADLRNLIGQEDLLPNLDDKLDIMEQICDGLAFAHSREVIHRDLKPGNIHVQPNGQVKILDFGLARLGSSEMTRTGTVMGTPHYMSPEQVLGDKVDLSSDVFSIGAVFYELLCNHKPFDGDSAHAVLFQVVNKQPESVRKWIPDLPPILVELVEKAMVKDRTKRFQSAGVLREALARARRAIREGRAASTLEAEGVLGIAAPKSASDSFKSLSPKTSPPIPSNQQFASAGSASDSGRPRSSPPAVAAQAPAAGATVSRPPAMSRPSSSAPRIPVRERTAPPGRSGRPSLPPRSGRPMPVRSANRGPFLLVGGLAAVVLALGIGAFVLLRQRPAAPSPSPSTADTQVGALTEALVSTQVELAKRDLDDKNYAAAIAQADRALKLAPGNTTAQQVKATAQGILKNLDTSASEARARFDAGDMDAASAALGRVLAIDPKHPVAKDLSASLDRFFQSQAEQARRDVGRARDQAERARATTAEGFAQATSAARDAEALLAKGQFAVATRGFLEARDAFDRARRAVETQAREAAKPASPPAAAVPSPPVLRTQAVPPPTPPQVTAPPATAPPATAPAAPAVEPPAAKSVSLLAPKRAFIAGETVIRSASAKKGPAGFDTEDVTVNPDFLCRIRFDPTPDAVRAGEGYRLKVFLLNEGEKAIKIRDLTLGTTSNGARSAKSATLQTRDVPPRQAALLTDVSGVIEEGVTSWSLEASVSSAKGDVCRNQVAWK